MTPPAKSKFLSEKTTSRWMLLLIVLLIAAALAALMAQLSGQAIWLK